jgi:dTDP-4-dehydrorhamnose 3,5-epimerase
VPPHTQAKLITVLRGSIWDIAVDLRPHSLTFGKWTGVELSAENKKQFFIPKGFAHGFVVLSKEAEIFYKCDNYYNPKSESGIYFEDKAINIDWKIAKKDILLSDKDAKLPSFENIKDIFQNL